MKHMVHIRLVLTGPAGFLGTKTKLSTSFLSHMMSKANKESRRVCWSLIILVKNLKGIPQLKILLRLPRNNSFHLVNTKLHASFLIKHSLFTTNCHLMASAPINVHTLCLRLILLLCPVLIEHISCVVRAYLFVPNNLLPEFFTE